MTLPVEAGWPEPLQLPDVRRLERMPSLPAWVGSRIGSLKTETQPDPLTGKWRATPTLPSNLILKPNERKAVIQHVDELTLLCKQTPVADVRWQQQVWISLTKMMLVMPTFTQNEMSAEARGEAYLMALDDVPVWAVEAAIRRWYRHDCGTDEQGKPYGYHWCPAPGELRYIATVDAHRVGRRIHVLNQLLLAEPLCEFDEAHRQAMGKRLAELADYLRSSSVGKDGSNEVGGRRSYSEVLTVGRSKGTARPKA